jgi:hypothetical protein
VPSRPEPPHSSADQVLPLRQTETFVRDEEGLRGLG